MPTRKFVSGCAIAAALVVLGAASQVRAQAPTTFPVPPVTDLPRTCNLGQVKIEAGPVPPGVSPSQVPFPRVIGDCSSLGIQGECLAWDYRFSFFGVNPINALVSVESSIGILGATPSPVVVSQPGVGDTATKTGQNVFEVRFVRYRVSTSTVNVSYFTKLGIESHLATAGATFKSRNEQSLATTNTGDSGQSQKFCALAGAGVPIGEQQQAISNQVESQAGICRVLRTVDARGRTIAITLLSGDPIDCPITTATLTVDGVVPTFTDPETQVTIGTSSRYCWPSATGSMTCVGK